MAKGDIISRLKLESGEFDAKIKRAGQELLAYSEHCRKMGLEMGYANRDAKDFAKALGSMSTVSNTARGKINELSEAFINAKVMYKNMTDEEKKGEFGRNLSASLDQLKTRLNAAKQDLADVNKELAGSGGGKFGEFGNVIDTLGQKLGLTTNATELLTSKTALMYSGIGAGIAIIGKATDAWAKYNAELARQDQITTVTTGLKGEDANRMTDTMRALSDTYNVDFRDAINAANTLMSQFGVTGDEAIRLIKDGMKGMIMGDGPKLLSMIQQYAPAFQSAGVSASQLVAVIHNSEGGIFTDQNMNAIVMGIKNIRLMTKSTSEALAKLGLDGQDMAKKMSNGSMTVFDALKLVAGQLKNVDSNSQAAGEVMQQVFGRQGAMAGTNLAKAIDTLNTNLENTKKQLGDVGDAYDELQTANEKLNVAIRDAFSYDGWEQMATGIKSKLVSALATVIEQLGKIRQWFSDFTPSGQTNNIQNTEQKDMNRRLAYVRSGSNKTYWHQQNQEYYNQQVSQRQFKVSAMKGDDAITKGLRQKAQADLDAWKNLRDEYNKKANEILNAPPKSTNTTNDTVTPTNPKGGNKTNTVDKEAVQQAKMLAELRKAEAKATKEIADARAREHRTETTGTSGFNEQNIANWTAMMKDQLSKADFGSVIYDDIVENMRDMTTITDLTKEAMKRGLDPQSLGLTELFETAFDNIDVPDNTLQAIVEKINAAIKDGVKLEINAETGSVSEKKPEKVKESDGILGDTSKVVSGLSSVASGLQQMGVKLPKGIQEALSVIQGLMSVVQGVNTILGVVNAVTTPAKIASETSNTLAESANTVALGVLTAAITANTSALAVNSALSIIPFAHGGIIKAAGGTLVGTQYSGDNLRGIGPGGQLYGLNAGEVVLNRAEAGVIAGELEGGNRGGGYTPSHVSGEQIWIALNAFTKRTGKGELVTWR